VAPLPKSIPEKGATNTEGRDDRARPTPKVKGLNRGPKPDVENPPLVAEIVARLAPNGGLRTKLDDIREAQDKKIGGQAATGPPPATTVPQQTPKEYATTVGRNIDRFRKECGWSLDDLANEAEIDRGDIRRHINSGQRPYPRTAKKYSDAFSRGLGRKVTIEDLNAD
jgi:hypothetical protein